MSWESKALLVVIAIFVLVLVGLPMIVVGALALVGY